MKNRKLLCFTLFILFTLTNITSVYCQNNDDKTLYNWFDNKFCKENLDINNGSIHLNYDKTLNNENRYFEDQNAFVAGNVNYEEQDYFDVNLKYDILNDELILNPKNVESNYIGINLNKEKIKSFSINKKTFVNLSAPTLPPDFAKGFYQESIVGKSFTFYIKHYKQKSELIKDYGVFSKYTYKTEFILSFKNKFEEMSSKKSITNQFPEYKKKISDFYVMNEYLEKENKIKFMENLMIYINNLQNSETK
ncbi:MAG: hypothetical protein ABI426_05095 [Flavobacterium sp.]